MKVRNTRRDALICGIGMLLIGLLALGFTTELLEGVQSVRRRRVSLYRAPQWVAICASLSFVFGGLAVLLTHVWPRRIGRVFSVVFGILLFVVLAWLAVMEPAR